MTLLSIIQDTFDEVGFPRPSSVAGNTDQLARQALALLNREGKQLAREFDWSVLEREYTFATVSGTAEYALPSDYDHFSNDTQWDRTRLTPLMGPTSPQAWQEVKSGLVGTGAYYRRWRVKRAAATLGQKFVLDPTPTSSGDTIAFEYISNFWATDTLGTTGKSAMTVDTDLPLIPEHLLIMGLRWRILSAKGLEYGDQLSEYQTAVMTATGRDKGAPKLSLSGGRRGITLLSSRNVPDTGFGV
jgi:hypothetical protein